MSIFKRHGHHTGADEGSAQTVKDPVCGMQISPDAAAEHREAAGHTYYFCSPQCATTFDADPDRYLGAGA
ncbi:YHS domain-containing protein [Streptomyces luteolifulvus]|uniref:YHS domain-containing protein n=1 Tax=Streptomyces luteolifulvus TaxID=2615112 RepID=UPI001CD93C98